jgi:hypothetical protein
MGGGGREPIGDDLARGGLRVKKKRKSWVGKFFCCLLGPTSSPLLLQSNGSLKTRLAPFFCPFFPPLSSFFFFFLLKLQFRRSVVLWLLRCYKNNLTECDQLKFSAFGQYHGQMTVLKCFVSEDCSNERKFLFEWQQRLPVGNQTPEQE